MNGVHVADVEDGVMVDDATLLEEQDVRLSPERQAFVEKLALMLDTALGLPLTDCRVVGYLIMTRRPHSSSADLQLALGISSGAVSMATRRLVEVGLITREVVSGERSHYFRAERDVWGSWLATERRYLERHADTIASGLEVVDPDDPADAAVRERLANGRDYMNWLHGYHRKMLSEWEAFKAARDSGVDE